MRTGRCNFLPLAECSVAGSARETTRQAEAIRENGGRWQIQQAVQQGETRLENDIDRLILPARGFRHNSICVMKGPSFGKGLSVTALAAA